MAVLDQSAATDAEAPLGRSEGLKVSSGWRWRLILTDSEIRTHTQTHTQSVMQQVAIATQTLSEKWRETSKRRFSYLSVEH